MYVRLNLKYKQQSWCGIFHLHYFQTPLVLFSCKLDSNYNTKNDNKEKQSTVLLPHLLSYFCTTTSAVTSRRNTTASTTSRYSATDRNKRAKVFGSFGIHANEPMQIMICPLCAIVIIIVVVIGVIIDHRNFISGIYMHIPYFL